MTGRIERLCAHPALGNLDAFTERAARYGAADPLARLITAVRTGADPALLKPDLDALDEAFARHGVDNLTRTVRAYRPLPGTGEHPVMRAWVCPALRPCSRLIPLSGPTPPVCALTGQPLTLLDV
jgi:hypothetical protein